MRNVFGDSDEEEVEEYGVRNHIEHDSNVSTDNQYCSNMFNVQLYLLSDTVEQRLKN